MSLLSVHVVPCSTAMRISVLSGHTAHSWQSNSSCSNSKSLVLCNIFLYRAAIEAAATGGSKIIVLPEAYGQEDLGRSTFFETLISHQNSNPCEDGSASADIHPQQFQMSCAAKQSNITVVANIFTKLSNGSHRITEVVYGDDGAVLAVYHKHRVFLSEKIYVESGPYTPTVFQVYGATFGILICWEGVYPFIFRDFTQINDLVTNQKADALVWSVGEVPKIMRWSGSSMAKKFQIPVLGTVVGGPSKVFNSRGEAEEVEVGKFAEDNKELEGKGYIGNAEILHVDLEMSCDF